MRQLQHLTKESLHHAHLLIRHTNGLYEEICPFFENQLNIKTKGNADFIFETFDKFLIDDARRIFDLHLGKTSSDSLQIIVIAFNYITHQAQNALLKMLEEPTQRTHFFIVAPDKQLFLQTVLSRVSVHDLDQADYSVEAEKFLSSKIKDRIKFIADLSKNIKEEKNTKQDALNLLSGLEVALRAKKDFDSIKEVISAKKYMNNNGASVKILLENVALNV